jgi:hypothetical protein
VAAGICGVAVGDLASPLEKVKNVKVGLPSSTDLFFMYRYVGGGKR